MRLVSYLTGEDVRAGVVLGPDVYDVAALLDRRGWDEAPGVSARRLLQNNLGGPAGLGERLAAAAPSWADALVGPLEGLPLAPPVPDPTKVRCVGHNHKDHAAERGPTLPSHPDNFAKFASTLIGPTSPIGGLEVTDQLDFEGELALEIGEPCRNISEEDALDATAGLNDITARNLEHLGTQWLPGKVVDDTTFSGLAHVTLDEMSDPDALDIRTRVDSVVVQNSNTRHLIFWLPTIVSFVSIFLELQPHDVMTTGTPEGIGAKHRPPLWLRSGDLVEEEAAEVSLLHIVVA